MGFWWEFLADYKHTELKIQKLMTDIGISGSRSSNTLFSSKQMFKSTSYKKNLSSPETAISFQLGSNTNPPTSKYFKRNPDQILNIDIANISIIFDELDKLATLLDFKNDRFSSIFSLKKNCQTHIENLGQKLKNLKIIQNLLSYADNPTAHEPLTNFYDFSDKSAQNPPKHVSEDIFEDLSPENSSSFIYKGSDYSDYRVRPTSRLSLSQSPPHTTPSKTPPQKTNKNFALNLNHQFTQNQNLLTPPNPPTPTHPPNPNPNPPTQSPQNSPTNESNIYQLTLEDTPKDPLNLPYRPLPLPLDPLGAHDFIGQMDEIRDSNYREIC